MSTPVTKIRWGVLSTANIGLKKVIPGMQAGQLCEIVAIASRDLASAQKAAAEHGIARAYGCYEELLADAEIDAVYIPLPNNLHMEWTSKAAEAGKHVLCEKPVGMHAGEARQLIALRDRLSAAGRPVKIGEAFMVRVHPQWIRARELVSSGRLGELRLVQGAFSYFNVRPENIRNSAAAGGGALLDIGCYLVFLSRLLFGQEPSRALALIDRDPAFRTDRLTSMLLDFPAGQAIASCSTQLVPYQRVQAFGSKGRLEIEIPVNTPPDRKARITIDDGGDLLGAGLSTETFAAVDQYTLQGDAFARAILDDTAVPVPLEDSVRSLAVIDALFRSAESGLWETVAS